MTVVERGAVVGHFLGCNVPQLFGDGAADSRVRWGWKEHALGVRDSRQSTSKHNITCGTRGHTSACGGE